MHHSIPNQLLLVNVSAAGGPPFPAIVIGEKALAVTALIPVARRLGRSLAGAESMIGLLSSWKTNQAVLLELMGYLDDSISTQAVEIGRLTVQAPVMPGQVFCTIGNYRLQIIEAAIDAAERATGAARPDLEDVRRQTISFISKREAGVPYICSKSTASVVGPNDELRLASDAQLVDWEVELAVVIGSPCYQVSEEEALRHIAGFTIANDITSRDRVFRADPPGFGTDWLQCKSSPGFLPLGPYLLPWACVSSDHVWELSLKLNGQAMQHGFSSDMIFGVAQQISYLSQHVRLRPGDVICTGSPAGFGTHHQRFLRAGDVIEASIDGLGTQRTRVLNHNNN